MKRREFISVIGGAAAWPIAVGAQPAGPARLIGVLMGLAESDRFSGSQVAEFRTALASLGWKEGGNLRIELRWGAGDENRIAALAKELVDLRPDAILAQTTPVARAIARETKTIPIVFVTVADPIGSGLGASLTHPGGNITGFTYVEATMGGKWVELLKEIAPRTARVALLLNPATASPLGFYLPSIEAAASSFAIETSIAPVRAKEEIEGVVAAQARTRWQYHGDARRVQRGKSRTDHYTGGTLRCTGALRQ